MTKEEIKWECLRAKNVYAGPPGRMTHEELKAEELLVLEKKSKLTASQRLNVLKRAELIRTYDKKKKERKKDLKVKEAANVTS